MGPHAQFSQANTCSSSMEDFSRAKNLLLGAVDTVLTLANSANGRQGGPSTGAGSLPEPSPRSSNSGTALRRGLGSSLGSSAPGPSNNSASFDEHRKLFNY